VATDLWQRFSFRQRPGKGHDVVRQLIEGIEAESADLGMVVTSVSISEEYYADKGFRIELVDGEQFASMVVERGVYAS